MHRSGSHHFSTIKPVTAPRVKLLAVLAFVSFFMRSNFDDNAKVLKETVSRHYDLSSTVSKAPLVTWSAGIGSGDTFELMTSIMTPFSPWFLTDFYMGDEFEARLGRDMFDLLLNHTGINIAVDCSKIPDLSTLFVSVNFFEQFQRNCLHVLANRIILITGQWYLPALANRTEALNTLENPKIFHWFAQNPITTHDKYTAIPYGVLHRNLPSFVAAVKESLSRKEEKSTLLLNLHMGETHPDRAVLTDPSAKRLPPKAYYDEISNAKYVVSPMGDRPDAYRHWESIGLGAIPVCNCPIEFGQLFGPSMLFRNTTEIFALLSDPSPLQKVGEQVHANMELLLLDTWRQKIDCLKAKL